MNFDNELLRRYAETGSEAAFAELVQRHVGLVYSAALRQVNGDPQMAQDVAQVVFTDLARKATRLSRHPFLAGWLYTSTHFAAAKAVRTECRRRQHEQEASAMHELFQDSTLDADWQPLRPVLDQLMHELKEADRTVLLMRFFEHRAFTDMGERLGLSEEAARKRVDRALEKLRLLLAKRGVTTSGTLGIMLSAHAVQIAPAGLAATLASTSLAAAAAGTGTTLTLMKLMTMTKIQAGIIGGMIGVGVLAPLVMQSRALANLTNENQALRERADQWARLAADNQSLSNRLAAAKPVQRLPADRFAELLRLRGEAGRQQNELAKWRAEVALGPNSARSQAARERASKNYYPKESWATAGFTSPAATVQSMSLAASRGDFQSFLACMSDESVVTNLFGGKSLGQITNELASELASGIDQFKQTDGLRIVNEKNLPDGEVFLTFYNQGGDSWGSARLKHFGNEWKIVGNSDAP
jgi:RNA polymerase sigma factor (sigma-70 family)